MKVMAFVDRSGDLKIIDITYPAQRLTVYADIIDDAIEEDLLAYSSFEDKKEVEALAKSLVDQARRLVTAGSTENIIERCDILRELIDDLESTTELQEIELLDHWPKGSVA